MLKLIGQVGVSFMLALWSLNFCMHSNQLRKVQKSRSREKKSVFYCKLQRDVISTTFQTWKFANYNSSHYLEVPLRGEVRFEGNPTMSHLYSPAHSHSVSARWLCDSERSQIEKFSVSSTSKGNKRKREWRSRVRPHKSKSPITHSNIRVGHRSSRCGGGRVL